MRSFLSRCLALPSTRPGAVGVRPGKPVEGTVSLAASHRHVTRYEEIEALCQAGRAALESSDIHEMLGRMLDSTLDTLGLDTGLVRLCNPGRGVLEPAAVRGYQQPEDVSSLPLESTSRRGRRLRFILAGQETWITEDLPAVPGLQRLKAEGVKALVTIPLVSGQGVAAGVLQLGSRTPRRFHPTEVRLMEAFAGQMSLGAERLRTHRERARLSAVVEASTDAVSIADAEGRVEYLNSAAQRFLRTSDTDGTGARMLGDGSPQWARDLLLGEAIPTAMRDGVWRGELAYLAPGGDEVPVSQVLVASPASKQGPGFISAIARDISEDKRAAEVLKHQALHDALTGLPNRTLLRERTSQAIAEVRAGAGLMALLVMDLDRFKEVNDTFGHPSGDILLEQVTLRVLGQVRDCDTVARLGGDEFALVLQHLSSEEEAAGIAARILKSLDQPFLVDGHELVVGVSIGSAFCPGHSADPDVLLRLADVAMYVAKRDGTGYAVYSPEQDRDNPSRAALQGELRRALDRGGLVLHFQPKVALSTGRIEGVEALVRPPHQERGLLLPHEFLPVAERAGLMTQLGKWVLRSALTECRGWVVRKLELPVAVNLGAHHLRDLGLPRFIAGLLAESGLPASMLNIEITESAIMSDHSDVLEVLTQLRAMGVRISIDDFGTGYSSLVYLKRLPVDEVKIDQTFVSGMAHDENDAAIVRSTIDLGHNLGLEVVAEGVEDELTSAFLEDLGCDIAQGHHIGRPMPSGELFGWVRRWRRKVKKRSREDVPEPGGVDFWGVA